MFFSSGPRKFVFLLFILTFSHLQARYQPAYSPDGMVASADVYATEAGFKALRAGGNAADAAVAVGFALAVTYPAAGNLGGGGFLVYRKPSGEVYTLDYREKAPAGATADMFLDKDGNPVSDLSRNSLLAAGVPGSVAGMLKTLELFGSGKLTRQQLISSALSLAEDGFPVPYELAEGFEYSKKRLIAIPSTARVFYPEGKAPEAGQLFKQPELANTLREIAGKGEQGFYSGWVADSIVSYMVASSGLITHDDLTAYRCLERKPVALEYKEYKLYCMGPPSSGGIVLGQILGLLEPFDLKSLGFHSAGYINRVVEAGRLAYADRNFYLGDPDYVEFPQEKLLSAEYLDQRRKLMPVGKAGKSIETGPGRAESLQTTHFCVVDRWGGVASVTTTINGGFGNGHLVPGAGFFLNNEMDDFATAPGKPNMFGLVQGWANAVAGGKRPLSSMTPTIVTELDENGKEKFFMALGAAGGPTIITSVLQIFLNTVEFEMNVRQAVEAPRFHHQHLPDEIMIESGALRTETCQVLEKMGYQFKERKYIGNASAVRSMGKGWFAGWADAVGGGAGTGW